jgi:hypothetical protein
MPVTKNYLKVIFASSLFFSFLSTSCIDNTYDLSKDIDLKIHVGGNALAMPIGNTDYIKLSKIIKADESDVIHLNGGEYSLYKEGTVDPVEIKVNSVSAISISPITLPLIDFGTAGLAARASTIGSVDFAVPTTSSTFELVHRSIPSEVSSIKKVIFPSASPVKATIKYAFSGIPSGALVNLSNLKLKFPDYLVSSQLNSSNELVLNEATSAEFSKDIYITSFDFSNENGGASTINNKILDVVKNITLSGGIALSNVDYSQLKGNVSLATSVQISPATISEIEGIIDPSISINADPVSFEIPEFLEDKEVKMDVVNPMINLTVTNSTDIPVIISGLLKGYRDGTELSEVAVQGTTSNPITIDANAKTVICLSRTGVGGPVGSKNYKIANLNDLIETIPNHIRFVMNARADQSTSHRIQLGKSYNVGMNYSVEVPFKFGSGLSIVYNDSIDGFNDDIKDLNVKSLNVTATVENNIPLALQLNATAVGINKNAGALAGVSVKITGDIKSCAANGGVQESPITIELTETTDGAIKNLDGLLLKVTAKSTETVNGMPLKEDQYIRLKNIKARAASGMDYDLND